MVNIHHSISKINVQQWNNLLQTSSCSNFFQSKECFEFYSSLSTFEPFIVAAEENDQLLAVAVGYIEKNNNSIKHFFTRRAIIPGGILFADTITNNTAQLFLSAVKKQLREKAIYLEIRNLNNYTSWIDAFKNTGFTYNPHLNFQIDTSNSDDVWARLSKSKRRQIKLAERNGVVACAASSYAEVAEYYECLKTLYKTKVKTPLFPIDFFIKLWESKFGKIFVIKKNQTIIGGIACVVFDKKCVYEWFVCGKDAEFPELYPSVLATWAGIKQAIEIKSARFDFMGAGSPDKPYGVREFKSKFGGKEVENGRFLYIFKPMYFNLGKFVVGLLKK